MRMSMPATGVAALCAAALTIALVPGAATGTSAPSSSAATSAVSQSAERAGTYNSRVRGTFGRDGTVRGTFDAERFFAKKGRTYATGVLHATLRRGNGDVVGSKSKEITIPVRRGASSAARGTSCDILNLVLGPLDLNLLGLEVHLKRVVLDIVAVPGPGNLLGNLLCAVAGLLDGPLSNLQLLRLSNLLNRILTLVT